MTFSVITSADLARAMFDKETGGVSFQKTVRGYLNECREGGMSDWDALTAVAGVMGVYRDGAEERVKNADEADKDCVRKAVNNVIGDVSRICRKFSDDQLTIKCKKKKPEYIYEVEAVKAKSEDSDKVEAEPEEDMEIPFTDPSEACAQEVAKLVEKYSLEEVGGALAEMIKAQKDAEA